MPSSIAVLSSLPSSHAARRAPRGLENTTPSLFSPRKLKVQVQVQRKFSHKENCLSHSPVAASLAGRPVPRRRPRVCSNRQGLRRLLLNSEPWARPTACTPHGRMLPARRAHHVVGASPAQRDSSCNTGLWNYARLRPELGEGHASTRGCSQRSSRSRHLPLDVRSLGLWHSEPSRAGRPDPDAC